MSEYKLVPVDAIRRAASILGSQGFEAWDQLASELESMIASAPAVQGEPVAWLTLCIKGDQKGQVEIDEPHGKATNPEYWTDAFAVYKTLKHADQNPATDVSELAARLSKVIRDLESGFVACERCGDQEDTATLDCMPELTSIRNDLAAHRKGGDV